MRVVLDTNVIISALLFGGKPLEVLKLAEAGAFIMLTSPPLRRETERILAERFLWENRVITLACGPLWDAAVVIEPAFSLTDCPDPDDNRVLECAVAGIADCIVTGDKVLLRMHPFQGIAIMRVESLLLSAPGL